MDNDALPAELSFAAHRIRTWYTVAPESLLAMQMELMEANFAPNTLKAFRGSLANFARYCVAFEKQPFPATSETMRGFITWAVRVRKYRLETVANVIWAVRLQHKQAGFPSPMDEPAKALWSNCRRAVKEPRQAKRALTVDQLRHLLGSLTSDDALETRDRAMIGLGFASALRRSELAALALGDVTHNSKGLLIAIRSSKTDQRGRGQFVAIPYGKELTVCPVRTLDRWLGVRGEWPGPLFTRFTLQRTPLTEGIGGPTVARALKRALVKIGIQPDEYGAHSLRAGMATAAAENGASVVAIQMRTRHRRVESVMRYIRPAQAFQVDPLAGVL